MTETKHKHVRPKTDRSWFRTGRGRTALVLVAVAGAVLARLLTGGSEDPADAVGTPGIAAPGKGIDWIAEDGSAYRLIVTPSVRPVSAASPSGCITAPSPDTTNLRFVVEVENRTPTAAEVPELEFAANVTGSGEVEQDPIAFTEASKRIEVVPLVGARTCAESSRVGPLGRERIESGASVTFTGTLAGVKTPVEPGLALIIRYAEADAEAASGSSKTVVRVPFVVS